jgi:hypothetical protein
VELQVRSHNEGTARTYKGLGFVEEGRRRQVVLPGWGAETVPDYLPMGLLSVAARLNVAVRRQPSSDISHQSLSSPHTDRRPGALVAATHDFPLDLRVKGMPMYSEGRP